MYVVRLVLVEQEFCYIQGLNIKQEGSTAKGDNLKRKELGRKPL